MLPIALTLAFLLELAALAALGFLGVHLGGGGTASILLAIALPLAAAVLWGAFAAPRAAFDAPALKLAVKAAVFGGALVALAVVGRADLAVAFAALLVVDAGALHVLEG